LDQFNNGNSNERTNGCEELMINNVSTLKSASKRRNSKTDTLVKKTFNKNELISDKLFDNEKYTENHFHHHHFDDQFMDNSDLSLNPEMYVCILIKF
jgi:hypothetical protein